MPNKFIDVDRTNFKITVHRLVRPPVLSPQELQMQEEGGAPERDWEDEWGFIRTEKTYKCAIGSKGYATPAGLHYVRGKARNPSWKMPDSEWVAPEDRGRVIPGDDPRNPLKEVFISLGGRPEDGIGFHGTDALDSIGTAASHGCLRMRPGDALDLYRRIAPGTLVFIYDGIADN